jgi:hypothetical protein
MNNQRRSYIKFCLNTSIKFLAMKRKLSIFLAACMMIFSACTNDGSSTVATQDDEQSGTSPAVQHHEIRKPERDQTQTEKMKEGSLNAKDTAHTGQH